MSNVWWVSQSKLFCRIVRDKRPMQACGGTSRDPPWYLCIEHILVKVRIAKLKFILSERKDPSRKTQHHMKENLLKSFGGYSRWVSVHTCARKGSARIIQGWYIRSFSLVHIRAPPRGAMTRRSGSHYWWVNINKKANESKILLNVPHRSCSKYHFLQALSLRQYSLPRRTWPIRSTSGPHQDREIQVSWKGGQALLADLRINRKGGISSCFRRANEFWHSTDYTLLFKHLCVSKMFRTDSEPTLKRSFICFVGREYEKLEFLRDCRRHATIWKQRFLSHWKSSLTQVDVGPDGPQGCDDETGHYCKVKKSNSKFLIRCV